MAVVRYKTDQEAIQSLGGLREKIDARIELRGHTEPERALQTDRVLGRLIDQAVLVFSQVATRVHEDLDLGNMTRRDVLDSILSPYNADGDEIVWGDTIVWPMMYARWKSTLVLIERYEDTTTPRAKRTRLKPQLRARGFL